MRKTARLLRGDLDAIGPVRDAQGNQGCVMPQQQISPPIFAAILAREAGCSRVTLPLVIARNVWSSDGSRLVSSAAES